MYFDEAIHGSDWLRDALIERLDAGDLVLELGSGPWSTPIFARIAEEAGANFITTDASPATAAWAKQELKSFDRAQAFQSLAEEVIDRLETKVAFAYMDNYDWVDSGDPGSEKYGRELSKRESELVHLEQSMKLLPRLAEDAIVLFDDTWLLDKEPPASRTLHELPNLGSITNRALLDGYDVFGKGSLAVPYLLGQGFRVVALSESPNPTQILMKRERERIENPIPWDSGYFESLISEHRKVSYGTAMPDRLMGPVVSLKQRVLAVRATLRLRTRARALKERIVRGNN